jgi:hypothetical protein
MFAWLNETTLKSFGRLSRDGVPHGTRETPDPRIDSTETGVWPAGATKTERP